MKLKLPQHIDLAELTELERYKAVLGWFLGRNRMKLVIFGLVLGWVGVAGPAL